MKRGLLILVVVVLGSTLLASSSQAQTSSWPTLGTHIVQPGETIYCIARAYSVDPWAIAAQNRLVKVNLIHRGNALLIPNAPANIVPGPRCTPQFNAGVACGGCQCRYQHLVRTCDTLTQISLQYGVTTWAIAGCNCINNPNYIRIGDTLCIP